MKKKPDMLTAVVGFVVNFVGGAILGAVLGVGLFARTGDARSESMRPMLLYALGGALVCGLLASVGQDKFWIEGAKAYPGFRWNYAKYLALTVAVALLVLLVAARLR